MNILNLTVSNIQIHNDQVVQTFISIALTSKWR